MLLNHAVRLAPLVQLRQQANLNAGALWRQPRPAQQAVLVPQPPSVLCSSLSSVLFIHGRFRSLNCDGLLGWKPYFWPFGGLRTNRRHNLAGVCRKIFAANPVRCDWLHQTTSGRQQSKTVAAIFLCARRLRRRLLHCHGSTYFQSWDYGSVWFFLLNFS